MMKILLMLPLPVTVDVYRPTRSSFRPAALTSRSCSRLENHLLLFFPLPISFLCFTPSSLFPSSSVFSPSHHSSPRPSLPTYLRNLCYMGNICITTHVHIYMHIYIYTSVSVYIYLCTYIIFYDT